MPTEFNSDTFASQSAAVTNAAQMIDTSELVSGKVSFLQCKLTIPSGTGAADTFNLGYIPSGMTLIPGIASVTTTSAAGASTINLGTKNADGTGLSSDNICENQSVNTAGASLLTTATGGFISASSNRLIVVATISGALTAGRVIYFNFPLVNSN